MKIPHPSWDTAKYQVGQKIQFNNGGTVLEATVIGWDTQDRVLATYMYPSGVVCNEASIHINTIVA